MNPIRHHRVAGSLVAALLSGLVSAPLVATAADASAPMADASAAAKRPKICLVLSGGGARGAAHTGVLKVLEELRVPIDCIAGTSMGALVGGAYATGMSVVEMDAVMAGMSVQKLFKEKPPRQELAIRRKMDSYINYVGPEIGVGSEEAMVTKGLVSGVQLETVLRQLTKVRGYQNFDKLPIQFRAVATDLVTGKAVIFKDGEMANVMRASMSVPGAVAPAEISGMILVDGMLTSNLPVETARALGADVVIAVNVGTPLLKREQLNSIVGVAGQMLSILTEQNVQVSIASLKPTDILISPELGDFSTGDFDNLPKIAPLGEAAARMVAEQLARYSLPAKEYAALRARQGVTVATDLSAVDEIRFVNLKRVNPVEARAVMTTTVNAPIDQEQLDADMRRLYGTGDYEHLNYRVLIEGDKRVLAVDAVEKSWGPDYLRIGLELDSNFGNESRASVLATYRKTWVNSLGAEWRTDVRLGYDNSLRSEFYQPFQAASGWFAAPWLSAARRSVSVYEGDTRVAIYALGSAQLGLDLGHSFYQYGELRLGVMGGQQRQAIDTGPELLQPDPERLRVGGLTARLVMDRLDSVLFPRSGWKGTVQLYGSSRDLGAEIDYGKWAANASLAYSLGENTFNLALAGGGRLNNSAIPAYDQFQWGGFLQQSGYAPGQLMGEELSYGRLMYYRRISQGSLFEGAYGGLSLETGRVRKPLIQTNSEAWRKSFALFVGMDTLVGPLYLGVGRASDGATSAYLVLGPAF